MTFRKEVEKATRELVIEVARIERPEIGTRVIEQLDVDATRRGDARQIVSETIEKIIKEIKQ